MSNLALPGYIVKSDLAEKKIGKILIQFQDWMRNTKLKPSTRRVYNSRLKQLVAFIESLPVEINDFNGVAQAYIADAKQNHARKANTLNNMITLFRLIAKVIDERDIYFERETSKSGAKIVLTGEEQELYLHAAASGKSSRDLLLALLFLRTNIRLGEALNIKLSDLVWGRDRLSLHIEGRSGKRIETVGLGLYLAMRNWLSERACLKSAVSSEYLFPGQSLDGKMTGSSMDSALRKIGWRAGLNVSARMLRNSCLR